MTFRLTVVYDQPEDPEAFLEHYRTVHFPLAKSMPDVRNAIWGRCIDPEGGTPEKFVVTTMDWDTEEQALASLGSPEGAKGQEDLANFAQAGVTVLMVAVEESAS